MWRVGVLALCRASGCLYGLFMLFVMNEEVLY